MCKYIIKIGKWLLISIASIIFILNLPWALIYLDMYAAPNPSKPEIIYAEFPFKLEYELAGELFVVEDTLICEFDGFEVGGSEGKFRRWKLYLLSGKDRIILMQKEEIEIFVTAITLSRNGAKYYMGDPEGTYSEKYVSLPSAWYKKDFYDERENRYIFPAEEMWEKYKLRIISWEIADPIENTFR